MLCNVLKYPSSYQLAEQGCEISTESWTLGLSLPYLNFPVRSGHQTSLSHLETSVIKTLTCPFKIVHSLCSKNSNSLPIQNYSITEFLSYKSIFLGKDTKPGINGQQSAASIQVYLLLIHQMCLYEDS